MRLVVKKWRLEELKGRFEESSSRIHDNLCCRPCLGFQLETACCVLEVEIDAKTLLFCWPDFIYNIKLTLSSCIINGMQRRRPPKRRRLFAIQGLQM